MSPTLQKMQLSSPCDAEMPSAIANGLIALLLVVLDKRTDGSDGKAMRFNGKTTEDQRATSCERTRRGNGGAERSMGCDGNTSVQTQDDTAVNSIKCGDN